jgi:hypothetical protein
MKPPCICSNQSDTTNTKTKERGNLPTFPDVTLCLTLVLEELPDTLVAKMDFTLFNDSRFHFGGLGDFTLQSYSKALNLSNVGSLLKKRV